MEIELRLGNIKEQFIAKIKNEIRDIHVPKILDQISLSKRRKEDWLLISQYIPKPVKQELKNQGINYLEASGNCFIKKAGIFLLINDKEVTSVRQPQAARVWNLSGMSFVFAILLDENLLNESYRSIANKAGVALGSIGTFIEELKEEGFIKEIKNNKKELVLKNKEQLITRWVELYAVTLLPSMMYNIRFRFANPEMNYSSNNKYWKENWNRLPEDKKSKIFWGGEAAGALLTKNLSPEQYIIYTLLLPGDIQQLFNLIPDQYGNVEVRNMFWNPINMSDESKELGCVPPLLAYAELITSMDSRNREIAERIKKIYLT